MINGDLRTYLQRSELQELTLWAEAAQAQANSRIKNIRSFNNHLMDFNEPEFNDKTLTDSDMKHGTFSVAEDNATDEI